MPSQEEINMQVSIRPAQWAVPIVRRKATVASLATRWGRVLVTTTVVVGIFSASAKAAEGSMPIRSFEELALHVQQLAKRPSAPSPKLPEAIKDLTYDDYRLIVFESKNGIRLGPDRPFWLEAFHKGFVHKDDVAINMLGNDQEIPIPFSPRYFQYRGKLSKLKVPDDTGFAGFRIVGRYPGQRDIQEMVTFLGASYFRARAARNVYGASARGLAVNVGLPKPEEFPVFREYWVIDPKAGDKSLRLLALLDSESVAGAYEFVVEPGVEQTHLDVRAQLCFRRAPEKVGIAPLTSMWQWGDGLPGPEGDERPEVHDSDGLLIETAEGKWRWRSLTRLSYPSLVRFDVKGIRGFGFIQRDTDPKHYLDDEAKYHARPSVWIEPRGAWPPGAIELLELPAEHEGIDNAATWWAPSAAVVPGEPLELAYRVTYLTGDPARHTLAKTTAVRIERRNSELFHFEVDFEGPNLSKSESPPRAEVSTIRGEVLSSSCDKCHGQTWIAKMDVRPTGEGPVEWTVQLVGADNQALTEVMSYLCPLEAPPVSLPPWRQKELQKEEK